MGRSPTKTPVGGRIRVGIGGWSYAPWRGTFYPKALPPARELEFASRAVTAIEINATFYRLQPRTSFAAWARTAPDGFAFAIKGSRYSSNRRNLADQGDSLQRFFAQGLSALGDKLGPILWQLMPTKRFDADEIRDFIALLPGKLDGLELRHAIEARHESFRTPEFVRLLRDRGIANVVADSDEYPQIADVTADFVYARLQNARATLTHGYSPAGLDAWAQTATQWSRGEKPTSLQYASTQVAPRSPRDVFIFVIDGAKARAPAAARALLQRLDPSEAKAAAPRRGAARA